MQTFNGSANVSLLQSTHDSSGQVVNEQVVAVGPAASQIAIKQLGTNGGGFFNVNSAHPFENPTPLSNFLEMLSILLIPAALCYTFGKMIGDTRQGWAILIAMTIIFVALLGITIWAEQSGNPAVSALGVDQTPSNLQPGGNMEGKEARFGITNSALWATGTTAASNGSVNAMHDSFTPLGGLVPMWLMQLGEVVYGGVGSGLYGMLAFVIIAVFVAGLMIGRTPEYLGKKIEAYEMKMASLMVLIPVVIVLLGTAIAVATSAGRAAVYNPGAHGFSEILYAFSSTGNNNGSAFAGLSANSTFYNIALGLAMLFARYWMSLPRNGADRDGHPVPEAVPATVRPPLHRQAGGQQEALRRRLLASASSAAPPLAAGVARARTRHRPSHGVTPRRSRKARGRSSSTCRDIVGLGGIQRARGLGRLVAAPARLGG